MRRAQDEFVTISAAAREHQVSDDTVRRRLAAAQAPVFRDGKDRRRSVVRRSDLERAFAPQPIRLPGEAAVA